MTQLGTDDWEALRAFANRVHYPSEQVSAIQSRLERADKRPGCPYTLVVGMPGAGIELVVARWQGLDVARELELAAGKPLVVGPSPNSVNPRHSEWATLKHPNNMLGHIIILRPDSRIGSDTLVQLGSIGHLEQLVIVTRLGQPLNQSEREIMHDLEPHAATVRALIVGLPGEDQSQSDLVEVAAYAGAQMRKAGFSASRSAAGTWYTDSVPRSGTITDVSDYLTVNSIEVSDGCVAMRRHAVIALFNALKTKIEQDQQDAGALRPPPSQQECARLTQELATFLASLARELEENLQIQTMGEDALRTYSLDAIRGWGSYIGIEGHWMRYVDGVRPGTRAALLEKAQEAFALVHYAYPSVRTGPDRVALELTDAQNLAIGLAAAIIACIAVFSLINNLVHNMPNSLTVLLCVASMPVAFIWAHGGSRRWRSGTQPINRASSSRLQNWNQAERKLLAWFADHVRASSKSLSDELDALRQRFGVNETDT